MLSMKVVFASLVSVVLLHACASGVLAGEGPPVVPPAGFPDSIVLTITGGVHAGSYQSAWTEEGAWYGDGGEGPDWVFAVNVNGATVDGGITFPGDGSSLSVSSPNLGAVSWDITPNDGDWAGSSFAIGSSVPEVGGGPLAVGATAFFLKRGRRR